MKPFVRGPGVQDKVADYLEQLDQLAILNGRLIECTFPSTPATYVVITHGLGRAYRGAIVVGQSDMSKSLQVQSPKEAASPSFDIKKKLIVGCGSATSMTFLLWVF